MPQQVASATRPNDPAWRASARKRLPQRLIVLLCWLGALAACRRSSAGHGDAGAEGRSVAPDRDVLRDDARLVLERHCGECHVRDSPTAPSGALAVFDLREPDWSARMSDAQLRSAAWRLGEPLPPEGRPSDASPEERVQFQRYVDADLVRRASTVHHGREASSEQKTSSASTP